MKVSFLVSPELTPKKGWHETLEKGGVGELAALGHAATAQSMIYQTWFWLKQAGVSCDLVPKLPKEGIVIFISNSFSPHVVFPPELFCVDVLTDTRLLPCAHFHLIQNKAKARWTPHSLFVPHWPQPNLIRRNPIHGTRFEKVSFFGDPYNLAPELQTPEWIGQLRRELGMFLEFQPSKHWHDYSNTDVVVAIRDFSHSTHYHKPAAKLYNAWLAGVPFIGGRDSAYAADGRPGIDYLVATSPQQVIDQLRRLKEDPILRQQLVNRGQESGTAFSPEAILPQWKRLITETLPALAVQWKKKSSLQRRFFWITQRCSYFFDSRFKKPTHDDILMEKIIPGLKNYFP